MSADRSETVTLLNQQICPLRLAIFLKSETDRIADLYQAEVDAGRKSIPVLDEVALVDMSIRCSRAQSDDMRHVLNQANVTRYIIDGGLRVFKERKK